MKRIISIVLIVVMASPAFANIPQRSVDWSNDTFTPVGQFFAGASYGLIIGPDVEPRTEKEEGVGMVCHLAMTGAMMAVNPGFGLLYLGVSALISGVGRATYKPK